MMHDLSVASFLTGFSCLGDRCEDTCCRIWGMQLDEPTRQKYIAKAPELLDAVMEEEGAGYVMRRNPATSYCVKFEDGLCGIHKKYGTEFLGDACHFYPRVTRALGEQVVMTAAPSCPEIVRLALFGEEAGDFFQTQQTDRLPNTLKDYLPEGMSATDALNTHRAFLQAASDQSITPEHALSRIASVAQSLEMIPQNQWAAATPIYLQLADGRLQPAQPAAEDPFNILHALCGLIVASHKTPSARLQEVIAIMEKALACKLDWQNVQIQLSPQSADAAAQIQSAWRSVAPTWEPALRRWLRLQLSLNLFPFAGLGDRLSERATLLGFRFAVTKLALICAHAQEGGLTQERLVFVVQSLSRILDHLGDGNFMLQICAETGWNRFERLRGLIEL